MRILKIVTILSLVLPLLTACTHDRENSAEDQPQGQKDELPSQRQTKVDPAINKEFLSIESANLDRIREIIDKGADVNTKDDQDRTRLWWAAFKGETSVVELLLKKGADPNIKCGQSGLFGGFTALHALGLERDPKYIDNSAEIAELLIKHGADVNARSNMDITPIDIAASTGIETLVTVLKEHGAKPNCDPNRNPKLAHDLCDE